MKFGVRLPNSGPFAHPTRILELAHESEELGYHSVWVHDHILWGKGQASTHPTVGVSANGPNNNFFESLTTLAFLAGECKRIKFGIAAIILPIRNPVVLAKQLANIDVLSDSRLVVGVVPGAPKITLPEFEAINVDYHKRGKISDEYISVMKTIWSKNPASFDGEFVKFKDIEVLPKPKAGTIPVIIGGGEKAISEKALTRVVEHGDGWLPAYLKPEELKDGIDQIRRGFEERKRKTRPLIVHEMFVCLDSDEGRARRTVEKNFEKTFGSVQDGLDRSLIGSSDSVVSKLKDYARVGVDVTELKFVSPNFESMAQMVRSFAEEIAPSFS
jgi:probable F420-dependent oxidoreductase